MNETRRNVIVGIFVLLGLVALGIMIVLFGEAPQVFTPSYTVTVNFPSAGPVHQADPVLMNGLQVGQVRAIEPMADIRKGVRVICSINAKYTIPVDAQPLIKEQTIALGKPAVRIDVGPENSATMLPVDGSAVLDGYVASGIEELIPRETMKGLENAGESLTNLAKALAPVARDLHELFKPLSAKTIDQATGPNKPLANISTIVQRFDKSLKSVNRIMADPKNRKNLSAIITNFHTISEQGLTLSEKLLSLTDRLEHLTGSADDKLSRISTALLDNSGKLNKLLTRLDQAAYRVYAGKGSVAKMLNDPELYDSLVFTTKRLTATLDDLHKLIQRWQTKGVKLEGGVLGK